MNDVSYVTGINHAWQYAWQAQYLVRLEGECCCSAHCVMRINDASHFSSGTILGDVGG